MGSIRHHLWCENLTLRLMYTKKEKSGRAGTRTQDLTDVNRWDRGYVRNVILLELEFFNN